MEPVELDDNGVFVFGPYSGEPHEGLYEDEIEEGNFVVGIGGIGRLYPIIAVQNIPDVIEKLRTLDTSAEYEFVGENPFVVYINEVDGWQPEIAAYYIFGDDYKKGNILSTECPACSEVHTDVNNVLYVSHNIYHVECVDEIISTLDKVWEQYSNDMIASEFASDE